jgi:hypothetical protein
MLGWSGGATEHSVENEALAGGMVFFKIAFYDAGTVLAAQGTNLILFNHQARNNFSNFTGCITQTKSLWSQSSSPL